MFRHAPLSVWERLVYRVPWALVLFWALIVYAVVERLYDHLTSADVIDAATAAGVLAIGHGVHHAARGAESGTEGDG